MSISKSILPEFDHEMATSRRVLERIVDDKFSWKPHEKSMTLGELATHVATIPSWTPMTFDRDELDLAPPGQPAYRLEPAKSRDEVLAAFDKNVASARAALEAATDENWQGKWSLLNGGKTIFTLPRTAVMRGKSRLKAGCGQDWPPHHHMNSLLHQGVDRRSTPTIRFRQRRLQ